MTIKRILNPQESKDGYVYCLRQPCVYKGLSDFNQSDFDNYLNLQVLSQNIKNLKKNVETLRGAFEEYVRLAVAISESQVRDCTGLSISDIYCFYNASSSERVALRTRRGNANFIVANKNLIEKTIIGDLKWENKYGFNTTYTYGKRYTVIDYDIGKDKALIGYSGKKCNDGGIITAKQKGKYWLVPNFPQTEYFYYVIEFENI